MLGQRWASSESTLIFTSFSDTSQTISYCLPCPIDEDEGHGRAQYAHKKYIERVK